MTNLKTNKRQKNDRDWLSAKISNLYPQELQTDKDVISAKSLISTYPYFHCKVRRCNEESQEKEKQPFKPIRRLLKYQITQSKLVLIFKTNFPFLGSLLHYNLNGFSCPSKESYLGFCLFITQTVTVPSEPAHDVVSTPI